MESHEQHTTKLPKLELELIDFSIRTQLKCSMPPLTPEAVIRTLYHGKYVDLRRVIAPYYEATVED